MDNGFISEPTYACCSPIPHFFITSMFGKPGKWSTRFNFLKHIGKGGKLSDLASDNAWRKKQSRDFERLCEIIGRDDHKTVPLLHGFDFSGRKKEFHENNKWADKPVTPWWLVFIGSVQEIKEQYPDSPISHLFVFLTTLKNRKFDHEEMLMWMLCAYLEWIWLDHQVHNKPSGKGDPQLDFVHVNHWKPTSELNKLCTTRFKVLDEYLKHRGDRNFRHLRGPRIHDANSAKKYRKLSVEKVVVELYDFDKSNNIKSVPLELKQYRILFYFVNYFELLQLDMLSEGIPAIRIEMSFSRINEIQRKFHDELGSYFEKHSV